MKAVRLIGLIVVALFGFASSASPAQVYRTHKPRSGVAVTVPQPLSSEAAAMANAKKSWPGLPLCDEGGYRIHPCNFSGGGGGGGM